MGQLDGTRRAAIDGLYGRVVALLKERRAAKYLV